MSATPQLFDHLLLLAAIVCAATLVRLLRRSEGIGRGYALVVGGELLLSLLATSGDRFVGTIAICLVAVTVVLPWMLEYGSRWAFVRGHLVWVARLSSLRASLMLGSGLARQLPILEGLALLDRKGLDAALGHFRKLADEAEDPHDLALIHEQIVSMLFHGQRWDEGISYYERRFHSGYAAARPGLALGLLRAYGEAGRIDTAARLLRQLEDGPIGADPKTAELLGQARLTFLAYAGAVGPVDEIVEQGSFAELGLSPATAELFLGIAHARAGEPVAARETLSKVEALAGPRDRRVREAARAVLERVGLESEDAASGDAASGGAARGDVASGDAASGDAASDDAARSDDAASETPPGSGAPTGLGLGELGPELRSYIDLVALRLMQLIAALPPLRRNERPYASYVVIALLSMVYGMHLLRGGGGIGLLELGALSRDTLASPRGWARPLTSVWLHADLVGLLFDAYAIWLAGQIVERLLGSIRMLLVTVVGALAGTVVSALALGTLSAGSELAVLAPTGGNLMAVGAITAALWSLTRRRTPTLTSRSRRNLMITLALLLAANLLMSWPTVVGVSVAPLGLITAFVFASAVVLGLPRQLPRWLSIVLGTLLGGVLAGNLAAAVALIGDDPQAYLVDHRDTTCELSGVRLRTHDSVALMPVERSVPFSLPIVGSVIDTLELRDGGLVQLAVVRGHEGEQLAIFELVEDLERELAVTAAGALPEAFAELLADDAEGVWRAADLWRNGERVGRVIERRLVTAPGGESATVILVATPAEVIGHAAAIHAATMRDAIVAGEPGEDRCW